MARTLKLLVVLALVGAACAGDGRTTVRFQIFGDAAEIDAYNALIDAFERTQPDIGVELVAIPSQGDHMARLATQFAAGSPPDLFLLNYRRFGQFAERGVLEPVGPRMAAAGLRERDYYTEALDAFRVDGELMCLSQNISSQVVYWNETLFAEAGIEPPVPGWDWDDFLAAAKALTRDTDGDGATDVYGLGVPPEIVHVAPFVWQGGGEVVDDTDGPTRLMLSGRRSVEALGFFIDLRRVHEVAPSQAEAESEDIETRFAAGRLGMIIESRRFTAALRDVEGLDWDVAPLPRGREEATMLHADAYCMAAASEIKDEAFSFVAYALGPEGAEIVSRSGRTVPSLRSVAESDAFLDPTQEPESAQVWLDNIPIMRRFPNIATWNEIETRANPIVEEWFYSREDPFALAIEILDATQGLLE